MILIVAVTSQFEQALSSEYQFYLIGKLGLGE
jgi:hypothetical protein